MKGICLAVLAIMLVAVNWAVAVNLDDFNGNALSGIWEYRDPANNSTLAFQAAVASMSSIASHF
jgi:hypothetical protein